MSIHYQILTNAIDNKIGANSILKTWILETKDIMLKNAGYVTPTQYDNALVAVYNKLIT